VGAENSSGPLTCGSAKQRSSCDGSPELRDPPESSVVLALVSSTSVRRAGSGIKVFRGIHASSDGSVVSARTSWGQTEGLAMTPTASRETPVQDVRTSFRHPQDGDGLGSLLLMTDQVQTTEGTRYRHGFDAEGWTQRIVTPALAGSVGPVERWTEIAYPSRLADFEASIGPASS
jgi:hypothetical protein